MPKETFFNLPEEKRAHITNIAIEEFAENEYADVSISRIVARAGIAKGSFYQYFEDKEDLHSYLLDLAVQKKWELFGLDRPDPQHIGVFRYLHKMTQASVLYQLTYPGLFKVGYRAVSRNIFPQEFYQRTQQEAHKFYLQLVAIGKEQGDIPPEIDDDLAAFIFNTVMFGLGQYLLSRIARHEDYLQGNAPLFEMPEAIRVLEQALDMLEHGLGKANAAGEASVSSKEQEMVR